MIDGESMTTLYFVRHGESESNLRTQFAGSLDMPLTQRGREQASLTAEHLARMPIEAVYSSDLSRAFDTGRTIADMLDIPIYATSQLREIYAGDWEGKSYSELEISFPDSYGVWRNQIGLAVCPNGESVAELQQRISACIASIVEKHPNDTICIATHATPIRVMECLWTDTPLKYMHTIPWVSNASITVAQYDENGVGQLLVRDFHTHLGNLSTKLAKNV